MPELRLDSRFRGNDSRGVGEAPAGSLRVSLSSENSLESLFDKEGLRELGGRGLKEGPETVLTQGVPLPGSGQPVLVDVHHPKRYNT